MAKRRFSIWLWLGLLGIGGFIALILGIWSFFGATSTPLHSDPASVTSVARPGGGPEWAKATEEARAAARAAIIEQNLPGLSIAVGAGGDLAWAEAFGWADAGTHELDFTGQLVTGDALKNAAHVPATPDTRFSIVGVSIPLTSAAVGLLLERGDLALDDEIQKHVPQFPQKPWPVTLRQLMAHTAGIVRDAGDEAPMLTHCEQVVDAFEQQHNFAKRDLLFQPGTNFRHSTYGWTVVSAAVEAAARRPFFSFMRDEVFGPLGMKDTEPDAWRDVKNRATLYHPRFGADTRYGPDIIASGDHSCFFGGGGFMSTPSDLVRFGLALQNGKLLKPATLQVLEAPQHLATGEETKSALGWQIDAISLGTQTVRVLRQDDRRSLGTATTLIVFPDRGLVVAVMANETFADTAVVAKRIAEIFAK